MQETESQFRPTLPSRLPCALCKKVLVRELYRVQKEEFVTITVQKQDLLLSLESPGLLIFSSLSLPTGLNSDFCFHRQFHRPLDTVSGLLNLPLLYHVWLCGVFVLMTWCLFGCSSESMPQRSVLSFCWCFSTWSAEVYFGNTLISMLLCPKPFS